MMNRDVAGATHGDPNAVAASERGNGQVEITGQAEKRPIEAIDPRPGNMSRSNPDNNVSFQPAALHLNRSS